MKERGQSLADRVDRGELTVEEATLEALRLVDVAEKKRAALDEFLRALIREHGARTVLIATVELATR